MSVAVSGVTKKFGSRDGAAAVAGVSFEAAVGEITSLLGPSGSGKSTLLRLIAGLESPDSGSIVLQDRDVTRVSPRDRRVGFVFQSYALFRHMTVFDNIAFGMRIRKRTKIEIKHKVEELLALVQLPSLGARFPSQLSGGQRQRVALARALATEPQVLLLDEPFGALDAKVRVELREWLAGFQQKTKVTTLLVTHDQQEAFELSQHVVLLNEGKVEQAGSPHDLYDHPATPFVASFLGGANVLRGTIRSGRAEAGGLLVTAPKGAEDGDSINAFVRPEDIRLVKPVEERDGVALARVDRLTRVGASVKISLSMPDGEQVTVQMSRLEIDSIGIETGDRVLVDLRDAKVFVEDYAI
ncbi:MAG TPA: sulfate/molybdate ABC transporter ATP-binding protein [Polyangiaceae bacterium]|jgi:sulfate transport system ATP-binding protein|nr:sulfate/molybdate ABC transporter ATP-binding protein [Polyangiaceae bacterium]